MSMTLTVQADYNFRKQVDIQASQVSGTVPLTNYAVLISLMDLDLRTVANGGHVENANGFDIIFTLGYECSDTILNHQIEKYDALTGEYIVWVNIPNLSNTTNTIINMYYGNNSITVDPSTTATWNNNYYGVYHFNNAVADATNSTNDLTDNLTSNFNNSKIGDGRDLNNNPNVPSSNLAGQFLRIPNNINAGVIDFTFSGWVFMDRANTNWERIFDFGQGLVTNFFFTPSDATALVANTRSRITINGPPAAPATPGPTEQGPIITNTVANTGSWIYWSVTIDNNNTTMTVYRNGIFFGSSTAVTLTPNNMEPSTSNFFGRSQYAGNDYIDAKFDEFRLSNTNHSADWIATEFNNQNSPATFYTVSPEIEAVSCCNEDILVNRITCDHIEFQLTNDRVDIDHVIWSIDGVVVSRDAIMNHIFEPGQHIICANYFGTQKGNPDQVCCEQRCITINIPIPEAYEEIRSICDFGQAYPTYEYNPCFEFSDFDYYTMDGDDGEIMIYYDSRTAGCKTHQLAPGYYVFKYYDENGCLIRTVGLTIQLQQGQTYNCNHSITVNCGDDVDLTQFDACANCIYPTEVPWSPWEIVLPGGNVALASSYLTNLTQPGIYQRTHIDPITCQRCVITVHVNVVRLTTWIPYCPGLMDLAALNHLIDSVNGAWCTGTYTELQIVETNGSLIPTGRVFTLNASSPPEAFNIPYTYTIRPTDSSSCCEVRITMNCPPGQAPPPYEGEYVDVFSSASFINNASNAKTSPEVDDATEKNALMSSVKVIPNPSSGIFNVEIDLPNYYNVNGTEIKIYIYNSFGSIISEKETTEPKTSIPIDISNHAAGTYHLKVVCGTDSYSESIIITKN